MTVTLEQALANMHLDYVPVWVALLRKGDPEAAVIRHNLWRELVLGHIPEPRLRATLTQLDEWFATSLPAEATCKFVLQTFTSQCFEREDSPARDALDVLTSDRVPLFDSDRAPDLTGRTWYYTTMCLAPFTFYCCRDTAATTGRGTSALAREAAMARALALVKSPHLFQIALKTDGLLFSGPYRFFWLADFCDALPTEIQARGSEAPTWLRAQVGTAHYADDHLLAFSIAATNVSSPASRQPTVFDARGYGYFRPSCRSDGWGAALDLDSRNDGRPEAIHAEILVHRGVEPLPVGLLPKEKVEYDEAAWAQLLAMSEVQLSLWEGGAGV